MGERHNLMTKTHRPTQLQKATEFCNTIPPKADIHLRSCYVALECALDSGQFQAAFF